MFIIVFCTGLTEYRARFPREMYEIYTVRCSPDVFWEHLISRRRRRTERHQAVAMLSLPRSTERIIVTGVFMSANLTSRYREPFYVTLLLSSRDITLGSPSATEKPRIV